MGNIRRPSNSGGGGPETGDFILDGTVGDFVTNYLSENGRRNQVIGELSINGSVQFIGLYQIWVSGLPYITNLWDHVEATGWHSSSNGNPGSGTPGSSNITGSWGGIFYHYTVNRSGN